MEQANMENQTNPTSGTSSDQSSLLLESLESSTMGVPAGSDTTTTQPGEQQSLPFNHPALRGKSVEDIEKLIDTLERTVKEQNQELNKYFAQLQAQQVAPQQQQQTQQQTQSDPDEDNFLAPYLRGMEDRLTKKLNATIAPLLQATQEQRTRTVRDKLKGELRYFATLEPFIDQMLRQQNVAPEAATEDLLRNLYHAAVGYAYEKGIPLIQGAGQPTTQAQPNQLATQPTNNQQGGLFMIPQHRPSSAPFPTQSQQRQKRPLTESEKLIARMWGMSEDEYLDELEKSSDDVVKPGFSKDRW